MLCDARGWRGVVPRPATKIEDAGLLGPDSIKRIPWPQRFVEAAFVVPSVLLALALNG